MLHCVNGIQQGNLKQGFGIYLYDDSTMYIGSWCNYQYSGEGIIILPYGGYFRGQFNKSNLQGKGWIVTKKEILIAQFSDSQLDGRVLQFKENKWKLMIYKMGILLIIIQEQQGTLQNIPEFVKQQEEYIILQQIIENRFDKQFQVKSLYGIYLGIKNGLGCRITDNTYIGQFKDGSLDGFGRVITSDGQIKDGLFKTNNQINGIEYKNNQYQIISSKVEGFEIIHKKSNTNIGYPSIQIRKLREEYHKRDKSQINRVQDKPFFLQRLKEISKDSLGYQYKEQIIFDTNYFSLSTIHFQTNDVESEGQTQFPFDTQRKRSSIIAIDNFIDNQEEILNNTLQIQDNSINSKQSSRIKSFSQSDQKFRKKPIFD
ncbi:hypothetical protein pb186bvf_019539 [Paramecium bursaria]